MQLLLGNAAHLFHVVRRVSLQVAGEVFVTLRVPIDEFRIDPSFRNKDVGQPIEQGKIGLGIQRQMLRRSDCRFSGAWVENDDLGR